MSERRSVTREDILHALYSCGYPDASPKAAERIFDALPAIPASDLPASGRPTRDEMLLGADPTEEWVADAWAERADPKALYVLTGSCPQTNAEARLEYADILEEGGNTLLADEYRAIVERMRADFEDPREHVKYRLGFRKVAPMDPDELVPAFGTMFWHEPRYSATVVCPCGHLATFLCDQPVGSSRTCDAPLCRCCRTAVADGIDQCDFHARTEPMVASESRGIAIFDALPVEPAASGSMGRFVSEGITEADADPPVASARRTSCRAVVTASTVQHGQRARRWTRRAGSAGD